MAAGRPLSRSQRSASWPPLQLKTVLTAFRHHGERDKYAGAEKLTTAYQVFNAFRHHGERDSSGPPPCASRLSAQRLRHHGERDGGEEVRPDRQRVLNAFRHHGERGAFYSVIYTAHPA